MIREVAFGVANRHNFQREEELIDLQGMDSDTFMSLYNYYESVLEYYGQNKTISG